MLGRSKPAKTKSFSQSRLFVPLIWLFVSGGGLPPPDAFATPINVSIDTAAISGTEALLTFDLFDFDGVSNNSAVVLAFSTDGTLGSAATTGDVSGSLPGTVTISDTVGVGELLQGIILGSSIAFVLDLTTNFAGGQPDSFSLFLLDPATSFSLVDTNLLGDALFTADIVGSPQGLSLSVSGGNTPDVGVSAAVVPEPSTFTLMALGLAAIFWRARCHLASSARRAFANTDYGQTCK